MIRNELVQALYDYALVTALASLESPGLNKFGVQLAEALASNDVERVEKLRAEIRQLLR